MTEAVKRMYKEAIVNKDFDNDLFSQDPKGYVKPNLFSSSMKKTIYACAYYGWLLGKGTYKRSNYIKQ